MAYWHDECVDDPAEAICFAGGTLPAAFGLAWSIAMFVKASKRT
ncbi:MAG: hypothetical protein ACRDNW_09795 [Trebonia sp.]